MLSIIRSALSGVSLFLGVVAICISMCSGVLDFQGDGIENAQTLTATVTGNSRYSECFFIGGYDGWRCNSRIVSPFSAKYRSGPAATFVATHMPALVEIIVLFGLSVLIAPKGQAKVE